jgi:hypothetical protein
LIDQGPEFGWAMAELEARALVGNGGLNTVLPGAVQLGLLEHGGDGRWHVPTRLPAIAAQLRELAIAAAGLGDEPISPLEKRKYRRRQK